MDQYSCKKDHLQFWYWIILRQGQLIILITGRLSIQDDGLLHLLHPFYHVVFMLLRMYCIDTEALVFMFNGGSPYGFTIHPIFTRICMLHLHY